MEYTQTQNTESIYMIINRLKTINRSLVEEKLDQYIFPEVYIQKEIEDPFKIQNEEDLPSEVQNIGNGKNNKWKFVTPKKAKKFSFKKFFKQQIKITRASKKQIKIKNIFSISLPDQEKNP